MIREVFQSMTAVMQGWWGHDIGLIVSFMVVFLLFVGTPLFTIFYINRYGLIHRWQYRNPYDRTCKVCRKHQVEEGYSFHGQGWWETYDEGDPNLHWWKRRKKTC